MRTLYLVTIAVFGMTAMAALAQPTPAGINPATDARPGHEPGVGESLPRSLPASPIGDAAGAIDYLRAARASLTAGRSGEARQSLEMAETRVLTRSVEQGQESVPDASQLISRIRDARSALDGSDNNRAIELLDLALSN